MNHHVRVCGLQLARRSLEASVCVQLAAVDQERHQHDYEEGDQGQSEHGAKLVKEAEPTPDDALGGHHTESFYEEEVDGLDQRCERVGPAHLGEAAESREALHEAEANLEYGRNLWRTHGDTC